MSPTTHVFSSKRMPADVPRPANLSAVTADEIADRLVSIVTLGELLEIGTADPDLQQRAAGIVAAAQSGIATLRPYAPRALPPLDLLQDEIGSRLPAIATAATALGRAVRDRTVRECAEAILSSVSVLRRMIEQPEHRA